MSQIASFYKLPAERFDDLVAAATPQVSFLSNTAEECEECSLPGSIFGDLDILLETHGLRLFELARRDLSERLSHARDLPPPHSERPVWVAAPRSRIPVFDHEAAVAARDRLMAHPLTEQEVRAHARESYGVDDEDIATATILAAFDLTTRWLGCVRAGEVAFLKVS